MVLADATQAWWQELLLFLWLLTKGIVVPVLITLGTVMLNKYLNIKLTEAQEKRRDEYAGMAVNYADQKLKKVLDEGEEPEDKNAQRMQWAMGFLEKIMETELDDKLREYFQDLIEAKLGEKKAKAEKLITMSTKSSEDK